jgi:hypothetical protein
LSFRAFVSWRCLASPKIQCAKSSINKAWCDGYRFATSKGKPFAAAAAKTEMKQDSPDFAAIARRCGLRPVHRDT